MSVLQNLYNTAKQHKDNHKSCGGEPYKSFENLFAFIKNINKKNEKEKTELKILEIGTAVGFTTYILHNKINLVDTIEFHQDHADEAKENILNWGGNISKINFLVGDAKDVLPTLDPQEYDLIFFDGYGVKHFYYHFFEKLLKKKGYLITANKHLKSTENIFFEELSNFSKWEFIDEFADTVIYKKL